jgi:hypothetical protein
VSGGRRGRASHSDGGEGSGSPATAATAVSEDPAELVHIVNTLAKKTQQLPD